MPLTPFHLGPGALFKAIGGNHFSFVIFAGSQVLMDLEPLVTLLRDGVPAHGSSHTLLGAVVIGLVSGMIGKPVGERALRYWRIDHAPLRWRVSFLSALIGTFSHIALDAVMHRDMEPLWPISAGNAVLEAVPRGLLHMICVLSGIAAAAIFILKRRRAAR